ncbi:MAG: outer membrane protein assembly factor BamC [Thiotrichales bacterium]|jgi:outer membrane protein assembly factor BamC|nr:outer membrane protein assembly factor BamC [Thiotrichales bacterium]MBT3854686.1 outer membrane protein assembly factor BamC [Thiotrichales bacterium]MBT4653742.1 outer membrane protein assembly factor BamC [Thiotrichales bacterium]MBT5984413.1 outer membrane protein assembly factor BamC [Thiotrichales bacterium]MBT6771924.1 outer membrane protein assembly factor BamC [Thiotrichales bacterium]
MKITNYLLIALISLFVASCSKVADPIKKFSIGSRAVNYETNENVDSLVIPPDLTAPSSQGSFTKVIEVDNSNVLKRVQNVEVKRDKYRRWLLVDLPPNEVWTLSKEFFRSYGFTIEKENQKIGVLETDYLEIETNVPDKSLGAIRASLSKILKTQYGLPIADKYRIRIEPTANPMETEVYLTLSSIGEVVNGAMRVWQPREKDVELETEMLLQLMIFLGSERADSIAKIQSNLEEKKANLSVVLSETGYASLVFPFDKNESWELLGWALDELSIDIDDRDQLEGSYFINVTTNKGLFSKLLPTASNNKTYQLILKEDTSSQTKVIFVDLSEEDDQKTISYSAELFDQIASKF